MKLSRIFGTIFIASTYMTSVGCDVNKHMEDVGFKKGENPTEKGVIKYDTLVDKDEDCNRTWSDYEAQLQRRSDLIPMLVETAKGFAAHEHDTLQDVITARAASTQIKMSSEDLTDPAKMEAFQKAQSQMKGVSFSFDDGTGKIS